VLQSAQIVLIHKSNTLTIVFYTNRWYLW